MIQPEKSRDKSLPTADRASEGTAEDVSAPIALADLRGLRCPLPVLKTAKRLTNLAPGDVLEVLSDDPLAAVDIPLFCRQEGQRLLSQKPAGGAVTFLIERGGQPPRPDRSGE